MSQLRVGQALGTSATADLGFDTYQVSTVAATTFTLTLPTAVGQDGSLLSVTRTDTTSGSYVVAAAGGQTINGQASITLQPRTSVAIFAMGGAWFTRASNKAQRLGGALFVDATFGNDSTGLPYRGDFPYLTPAAAVAAAAAGDTVFIRPGTYSLAAGITLPTNVSLAGSSPNDTKLQMLGLTGSATAVTMGNGCELSNVGVSMSSVTAGVTLTGVLFPGTTNLDARMTFVTVDVDLSGGAAADTLVGTAILVQGTGVATNRRWVNLVSCSGTVRGAGDGAKHGILLDTAAGTFSVEDGEFGAYQVVTSATAATYGGAECNGASGVLTLRGCSLLGSLLGSPGAATAFDISQTTGTIELVGGTALLGSNSTTASNSANSLGFTTWGGSAGRDITMTWIATVQANATREVPLGTTFVATPAALADTAVNTRFSRPTVVGMLQVRFGTGPGAGTVTIGIVKNAAAPPVPLSTSISVGLPPAPGPATDLVHSAAFAPGDSVALAVQNNNANTSFAFFRVTVQTY